MLLAFACAGVSDGQIIDLHNSSSDRRTHVLSVAGDWTFWLVVSSGKQNPSLGPNRSNNSSVANCLQVLHPSSSMGVTSVLYNGRLVVPVSRCEFLQKQASGLVVIAIARHFSSSLTILVVRRHADKRLSSLIFTNRASYSTAAIRRITKSTRAYLL
jgi:hypothetical protein